MFLFPSSVTTDVNVSLRETSQPCWGKSSSQHLRLARIGRLPMRRNEQMWTHIGSVPVHSTKILQTLRRYSNTLLHRVISLFYQHTIQVDYTTTYVSVRMTFLANLEIRCYVHTNCGSLQSAARSIFQSFVLLTTVQNRNFGSRFPTIFDFPCLW
jgi:hypothetical protein